MIATLTGQLKSIDPRYLIIDVGGVGYKVFASTETLARLRGKLTATMTLHTYLAVRENALDLYGFLDQEEREYFELLISISGIGPKSAVAILSLAPPEILRKAVMAEDTAYLTKVSGIGRKSAEKIILELRDKFGKLDGDHADQNLRGESEVVEALVALGYSLRDARDALRKIPAVNIDTKDKIREALKILASRSS